MSHETLWITQNLRTAPTPRHRAPGTGVQPARGGAPSAGVSGLRASVAPSLATGGRGGLGPEAHPWPTVPVDRPAVYPTSRAVAAGGHRPWLRQRAVDLTADRGGDSDALRGALSPGARLEALAPLGVELPGPGAPGHAARRASHRPLDALPVAGHKKKPDDLGPTSPSWMRVAFCSSPPAAAPGPPKGTRPS